ncbi:hypothetical protein, partial [Bacteroides xylanisolvens]
NLSATLGIIKINFPLSYLATANLELFLYENHRWNTNEHVVKHPDTFLFRQTFRIFLLFLL